MRVTLGSLAQTVAWVTRWDVQTPTFEMATVRATPWDSACDKKDNTHATSLFNKRDLADSALDGSNTLGAHAVV